jgi:hypothetical protein
LSFLAAPARSARIGASFAWEVAKRTTERDREIAWHLYRQKILTTDQPEQAKALLAILIIELRVNSRSEILPTYRVGAPMICAPNSSVGETGRRANHALLRAQPVVVS